MASSARVAAEFQGKCRYADEGTGQLLAQSHRLPSMPGITHVSARIAPDGKVLIESRPLGTVRSDRRDYFFAKAAHVIDHVLAFTREARDDVGSAEILKTSEVVRGARRDVHNMNLESGSAQGSVPLALSIQSAD
jgi:hypothetical protein